MDNTEQISKIEIRDMIPSETSIESNILSGLLMVYTTDNFMKAYKDNEYINHLRDIISFEKVIDDETESSIRSDKVFVSGEDIVSYFTHKLIQKYTVYQLNQYIHEMNIKKVLYINNTPLSFIIGNVDNETFTIEILMSSPDINRRKITAQFLSVCISEVTKGYHIKNVMIKIDRDFTDTTKIKSFLQGRNFLSFDQNNTYILTIA